MGHSLQEAEASCRTPITEQQPILNQFKLPSTLRMKYLFVIVVIACAVAVGNASVPCSVCQKDIMWAGKLTPEQVKTKAEEVCALDNVLDDFPKCVELLNNHGATVYELVHGYTVSQYCRHF